MRSKETYAVAVRREFAALHYLIGGDWGAENELHEHHYLVEIRLEGTQLDRHGYLIDIDVVTAALEGQVDRYRGQTLNSLPEFAGLNPSLEHLARIMGMSLATTIDTHLQVLTVRIWENEFAWAEYRKEF
ncbi:MAG: 6-carboxytetrahydropterin synthase [Desulfobacterales bacterium]|jgi:6-pyruvoyltetrahydropterin/6-carboxytetrahydropterin synthase